MKRNLLFISLLLAVVFNGCATYTAKNHLMNKEIEKGLAFTTKELQADPNDAYLNYYQGRFLLTQKKYQEAIKHFKIASESFPYKTYHKLWLGIAYGKNKEYKKEENIYLSILQKEGKYKSALVYLGKNYYMTKQYKKAIETFEKAHSLYRKPHSYMFFYYALALLKDDQKGKAKDNFLKYIQYYPDFSLAKRATYYLNTLGNFEYTNFKIGENTLSIKNISYLDNNELEYYSKKSLNKIANEIIADKDLTLYLISYEKSDLIKAERRVKNVKRYLLTKFPEIEFSRIKIAWFDKNKTIRAGKNKFTTDSYMNFFTKNTKDKK